MEEKIYYAHTKTNPDGAPAPQSAWQPLEEHLCNIWAKIEKKDTSAWHPLILHMLDVAAVAEAILEREPAAAKTNIAACLGMSWNDARPWLLLALSCHDLGKACPGFQSKWAGAPQTGLKMPANPDTKINHAFVSQIALSALLQEKGWPQDLADLFGDAVGCHHGNRASPTILDRLSGNRRAIGDNGWPEARRAMLEAIFQVFKPARPPAKQTLSGPEFMSLAGLTSFSDWIASDENHFPFGSTEDCLSLAAWFEKRRLIANQALDEIGWLPRTPLSTMSKSFKQALGFAPRPLQKAVSQTLKKLKSPAILLVEAPMGEGKTEAAFYAHLELQRRFGHRGLYVAMPTKATGNAMFGRTLEFLRRQGMPRRLDMQLLHGSALSNDTFNNLRLSGIGDPGGDGEVRAAEWFTSKKKALLSEYGVGTVDQALMPILPVRHNFMRFWGLANRVVIFDEIHAYDAYTGTLLVHLLRWLLAMGSSVVLLSATLSPSFRRKLAKVVNADLPEQEKKYPRLSVFRPGAAKVEQVHFKVEESLRRTLRLVAIPADLTDIQAALEKHLPNGGMGLALVNTVQRAQDLYRLFSAGEAMARAGQRVGKRLPDGTEILLFHARFPADSRQKREQQVLEVFNKSGIRKGRKILIATQVAEQSLDLDFDLIVTDLAPIDLVLQRAGRLWRHARGPRPVPEPTLIVAGLAGEEPPSFEKPLWWSAIYREDLLLRTWSLLRTRKVLALPDDIDVLVEAVYEGQADVPELLRKRLERAGITEEGEVLAEQCQANQAIIGLPDDASWNQAEKFVLYDEDEPGVHKTLMAQTRLGGNSAVVIPLFPGDKFDQVSLSDAQAEAWFLRALSLSRKGVVAKLQSVGVPASWKKYPLLRNCFPLILDQHGRWTADSSVRLDEDLGLVYETKETE